MDKLRKLLKRLKLTRIHNELDDILMKARKARMSPQEILAFALGLEVERREVRSVELGMTLANFPRYCTLEGFDFGFVPALNEGQIRDLVRLGWVREARNVLFLGQPGVGKTHLAIALGREAVKAGFSTTFVSAAELVKQLSEAWNAGTFEQKLLKYTKPKLLIIDELGYQPMGSGITQLMFQLVSARYERGSIVLTSNLDVSVWGNIFGDPTGTTAILDRLLHHSDVIQIVGDSYRLHEKTREGLFTSSTVQSGGDVNNATIAG